MDSSRYTSSKFWPERCEETTIEQAAKEKPSLIEELQRKEATVTAQPKTSATKYKSTNHVCGHTVIVESLFSTAGHIMTPSRKHMDPSTFEMLLLLKVNKDMYNALTLDECIEEISKEEASKKRPLENIHDDAQEEHTMEEGSEVEDA